MSEVAVMAGAMGGCEATIAAALRKLGYRVVLVLAEPVPEDEHTDPPIPAVDRIYDSCSPDDAGTLIISIARQLGEPLVLVHGFKADGPLDNFRASPKRALAGLFAFVSAAWPRMQAAGFGRIVNVVPVSALTGGGVAESAGASAVRGLTKVLALEGGRSGITANSIVTSCIGREREAIAPIGRTARPEDLARGVSFLCDRSAAFVTGTTLSINGGLHMY